MSTVSTISPLFLLVLISILLPTYGRDVGESCTIDNTSGICKLLPDCPTVYQELLAGKQPGKPCGFKGFNPIVCCPTKSTPNKPKVTTEATPTIPINEVRPLSFDPKIRGSLARAKCGESAEAVYGLEVPHTLTLDKTLVNVSRCALKTRKLIVGGKKADAKEFPHMAAVGYRVNNNDAILWNCGGTLISTKIVLTAAHCTFSNNWGIARWVRLGALTLTQTMEQAGSQTIVIEERIRHPQYKSPSEYHDIAILRLQKKAIYNEWVRPACLPVDLPDVGDDNKAVATGWGVVDWEEEKGSENLLKVTLNLVSHAKCNESFADGGSNAQLASGIMNDWQICAGEVGKDTCQGDSGGPLAIFNKDHDCVYNVIGVTSLGRLCGSIIPGVYTRVYHYIPWIERTAWPEYF